VYEGDLRSSVLADEEPFDLVTGSPPYWPASSATGASHPQAVPARIAIRGSVADYAAAASRILATGGMFVFVFPYIQRERAEEALRTNDLILLRRRDVVFKEGEPPMISLFAAARVADIPPGREAWIETPLIIRTKAGAVHPEYAAIRISFGFPPGDIPAMT
jgi:tRNA1(Val) A37 N6-methylase TrmN6